VRALVVGGLLALLAAAPAAAAPAPMECRGTAFTDAAGDAQSPPATPAPGPNHDVVSGFLVAGDDGRLTANLRVADLTADAAPQASGLVLAFFFTAAGADHYVAARSDGTAWTYEFGHVAGGVRVKDGDTTGTAHGATDDVVEIVVPASLGLAGQTLTATRGEAIASYLIGGEFVSDDAGPGAPFEVAACPPPPPPPPPPEPVPPPPLPPAGSALPATPVPVGPVTPAAPYTVTVPRLRARLLRRGRSFSVVVDPDQPVTRLTVTLSRGRKVLAKGTRASLAAEARVRVRVAAKRIRRGTYKLTFRGRTAAGRTAAGAVAVDVV
jgi:hypothetical protein